MVKYFYTQIHYCGKETNEGFAFNEGWASFWAGGECYGSYGNNSTDYTIEGNVANALEKLRTKCGFSYRKFVEVLEGNPGKIHSFEVFASSYSYMFGCE